LFSRCWTESKPAGSILKKWREIGLFWSSAGAGASYAETRIDGIWYEQQTLNRKEAVMEESQNLPNPRPQPAPPPLVPLKPPPPPRPPWYWFKRLFACNPFYLVSAALLLYGCYRVSIDPNFLTGEVPQLFFNYGSLQCYEVLLVVTAIFLARRRIWYDSTLLMGLENLLVLVPFILISQAALIDARLVWAMCLAGGLVAIARGGGLKRFIPELNLPPRSIVIGLLVLAVNVALPVAYRILHEHKFGTKPDWGGAYQTNQCAWWLLLPALCALANLVPATRASGELPPQRGWLPLGLFTLWFAGTGVHLYCLGYVYDFTLRPDHLAPAIWVLLWTLHWRAADWWPERAQAWKTALLALPLPATLLATPQPGHQVFLVLTVLNVMAYGVIALRQHDRLLPLHLAFISVVALVGGLPEEWGRSLVTEFSRATCVGAGAALYALFCAALSRNPKLGLLGALTAATAIFGLAPGHPDAIHWAVEAALAFLLLHSLRWLDSEQPGASAMRTLAGLLWVAHAFAWMRLGGAAWMACMVAAPVLAAYLAARLFATRWGPAVVPVSALVVMLSGPGDVSAARIQSVPVGLLAVIGSFLLFGLGTLAAMTRHRWSK
jgi:hypothetical protein